MGRRYDIPAAFERAVRRETTGRKTLRTSDFVRELAAVNWQVSLTQANGWIRTHTWNWRDMSTQEGDDKQWFQFNSNGGL